MKKDPFICDICKNEIRFLPFVEAGPGQGEISFLCMDCHKTYMEEVKKKRRRMEARNGRIRYL